jgi:hypothetical protein
MRMALAGWEAVLRRDKSRCRGVTGSAVWLQASRRPVIGALYPIAGNRVLIALAATPKPSRAARHSMIACAGRAVLNQVDPGGRIGRTSPQATRRLSASLYRPQGVLDLRRRDRSLAGVLLFAAGGALRIWPVFVLGHRFSGLVAIQPGHQLVTSGVYRIIRHPAISGRSSIRWAGGWHFDRRSAPPHRPHASAAPRRHQRRRAAASYPIRPRIRRRLPQPHRAAASRALLKRASIEE